MGSETGEMFSCTLCQRRAVGELRGHTDVVLRGVGLCGGTCGLIFEYKSHQF